MFLKKLSVFGFKSFADKTKFDFEGGVGGLVGPNGCGKSNVIDAFRWVLGETSMSTLRAKRYEDVIFNGTENRKKLGYCEVVIDIDNSTGHFKKYETNEISVKRRLYRDGESQYFINGARCNLKDIHELFLDTGVGKSAYSIIGQGEIEKIISTKPEKRREIFEEAAGIAKYKNKVRSAEKRLNKTEENLIRINDIIFEVEKNLKNLKVQADKAKEYKYLRKELKETDIQLALFKLKNLDFQREKIERRVERTAKRKDEIRKSINDYYKQTELKLSEIQNKEQEQKELQSRANDIEVDIRTDEHKIVMLREQHHSYEKAMLADQAKAENINERLNEIDKYINLRHEETHNIVNKIESYQNNLYEINEELYQIELTLKQHGAELTRLKDLNEDLRQDVSLKRKEQRKAIDELVATIDQKKQEFSRDYEKRNDIKNEIFSFLDRIKTGLTEKRNLIDEMINHGTYNNPEKHPEIKENFFQVLFELETCTNFTDKAKAGFDKYFEMEDGISSLIFDKKGIHARKKNIDEEIMRIENTIRDNIDKISSIENDIDIKRESREKFFKMINDINITLASLKEKKNAYSEEAKRTIEQKSEFELSLNEIREQIKQKEDKVAAIEDEIHSTIERYERNKTINREYEDSIQNVSQGIIALTREVQKSEEKQRELLEEERTITSSLESFHLRVQETEIKRKNIIDNFYDNYSVNLEEYTFDEEKFNQEELEKKRKSVKSKLNSIGDSVNLLAIEEYEEMLERHNFLSNQKQDLEDAKRDLVNIIKEINDISKKLFADTLEEIKINFNKLFKRLFNGGRANIVLLDPTDILNSGIEIEVQPPSKKLQNLSLLSGGEKTMTAIALMFAILQVRPSPFCLLDEIDAALDDINIGRFITLLQEFINNTQFLIITHNPLTIQTCDFLYGITMEEPGITKVFSVKPENKEKVASLH